MEGYYWGEKFVGWKWRVRRKEKEWVIGWVEGYCLRGGVDLGKSWRWVVIYDG